MTTQTLQEYIDECNAKTQAWIDEDPANRGAGFIAPASHFEESYGITTVEQFEQYNMDCTYSDLYKEIYGFRPRHHSGHVTKEEYDSLLEEHDRYMVEETEREARAIKRFEESIAKTIAIGAGDRETAIRWLKDALDEGRESDEYFEYCNQLPYGYLKREV
jgi:hypothetical protein